MTELIVPGVIEQFDFTDVKTGYVYTPDSRNWPMEQMLRVAAPLGTHVDYRYHVPGPVLNQGQTNSCVGYTLEQWGQTSPVRTKGGTPGLVIYKRALEIDEFFGEADTGTSLQAGLKVMQELDRVESYVWARTAEEVRQWILAFGSVVVGTTLTTGMRDVKGPGWYMLPVGNPLGGHAYLLTGYSLSRHAFRIINSWGKYWGDKGRAWLKYTDLDMLLRNQGDAVGIVEKRIPTAVAGFVA